MVIPLSLGIPCNWKIDPYAKIEDIIFLCKNNNFFDLHYTQKFWSHHLYIVYSINGYLKNFDLESPKNGVQGSFKSDSMNFVSPIQSCLWGIFPVSSVGLHNEHRAPSLPPPASCNWSRTVDHWGSTFPRHPQRGDLCSCTLLLWYGFTWGIYDEKIFHWNTVDGCEILHLLMGGWSHYL